MRTWSFLRFVLLFPVSVLVILLVYSRRSARPRPAPVPGRLEKPWGIG